MPNPRAQRQVALNSAVDNLKELAKPAQALGDMLASTLRGSVAATAGAGGDIRELIDLFGPEAVEKVLGKRVMPTTEEMKQMLPKATSYEHPYESIGEFLPLPGTGGALKAAGYGLGRAAGAGTRAAGQAVSDAMIHQAGPLASGPLAALAPRMAMTNVVKPKGGNWESGAVEKALAPMRRVDRQVGGRRDPREVLEEMKATYSPEAIENLAPALKDYVKESFQNLEKNVAMNDWVDRNLTNYVKKEMGTPEDPIRRLAEQGITHFPAEELRNEANWTPERLEVARRKAGFPAEGMGQSPEAKGWEIKADTAIEPTDVGTMRHLSHLFKKDITEPWMAKVPDETKVYMANDDMHASYLGFDHILDVLRQDVAAGRIRPEQLSKVSMEQAVRRTHEFDQEMARKMAEAQLKQQEGFPVHKEYPEGYKWIELAAKDPQAYEESIRHLESNPSEWQKSIEQFRVDREKQLADALKYEGDTMGHCVGGYCPDVLEGRSRIYSLRDKKGEPHVTVEVKPNQHLDFNTWFENQPQELRNEINARARRGEHGGSVFEAPEYLAAREALPPSIKQIKGKQNAKPKEDYIPYVQDFVRSGEWSDIGDFKNTGLIRHEGKVMTPAEYDDMLLKELTPPEDGMAAGGTPRPPTDAEREIMRKLRESFLPAADKAERAKRNQQNLEQMNKKVSFSDNPDTMMMELGEAHMAKGGAAEKLVKLLRAPAKSKSEIEAIAQRMAPQITGEYVRASDKSAKTVAGKTQKQFEREKTLEHDIRPTGAERPSVNPVDIESLKGNVMMGISGDPTITGHTVHGIAGRELRSPSPQHGGPLYGLGHDKDHFWASNLGAAQGVQNRARELGELYQAPVVGNYVKMGPDSYSYAQHFADANLQNIRPEHMTKAQIEGFNKLVRQGSLKSGPRPSWAGIENPEEAYLQMAVDPELRKHFGNLMQMPTVTEKFGLPSGLDVAHAVTEPDLRNLEIGVTGKSMGMMRPDVTDLKLSEHPTYSHDIPGQFIGGLKYPTPYELTFPDTLKSVRENPQQAPQEFGSFKMVGPRQIIDPQLIDEIMQYEEFIKKYTGKADGGEITVKPKKMAGGGEITAEDLEIEERPL